MQERLLNGNKIIVEIQIIVISYDSSLENIRKPYQRK